MNEEIQKFLIYNTPNEKVRVDVFLQNETLWLTQKAMATLFDVAKSTVSEHLTNIFNTEELKRDATVREFRTVQIEGERNVTRNLEYYNLDAIISVGYRVNSSKATQFRIWATQTLKEFIIKGFVMDDERLKQGQNALQVKGEFTNKSPIFLLNVVLIMIGIQTSQRIFMQ
ncbi:virulence RhuM family protein [Chryseobacterium formosus]|nr:RhuM family protein [Chryseobacterium formosus]